MQLERRALYNSLRFSWIADPTLDLAPWQVEDYRKLSLELIFSRLHEKGFDLEPSFVSLSDSVDSPEEFVDALLADSDDPAEEQDQIYLLVFELWRRLKPEKQSLSLFCDELDYQIHLYDLGDSEDLGSIQDTLANLKIILDENVDSGIEPAEAFAAVSAACANDIESFLYDFISEQIDHGHEDYAAELIDEFHDYVHEVKWFEFLRARILSKTDTEAANQLIRDIVEQDEEIDLDFYFDLLAFMVQHGEEDLFREVVDRVLQVISVEEDFNDLLTLVSDFYHCLDSEVVEQQILALQRQRASLPRTATLSKNDPGKISLRKILEK